MTPKDIATRAADTTAWAVIDAHHLERELTFPDFVTALAFVNHVGALAEEMDHHPDIHLSWGKVVVSVWTHSVGGLTDKDFALARGADGLLP